MFDDLVHETCCPFYRVPQHGNSQKVPVNAEFLYDQTVVYKDKIKRTLCVILN